MFIDEGHTLDFTNKAFEALGHVGPSEASIVLPTLVRQTAGAQRSEEFSEWRHPHDLVALVRRAETALPGAIAEGVGTSTGSMMLPASGGGSCPTIPTRS